MDAVADVGFEPLLEELQGETATQGYDTTRIEQAMRAQGVSLAMLNSMDKAALMAALAMDSNLLEQGNVIEAMRSSGGLRDFMKLTDEERMQQEDDLIDRVKGDKSYRNHLQSAAIAAGAVLSMGRIKGMDGVKCTGSADGVDLNHITGECLDGHQLEAKEKTWADLPPMGGSSSN